MLTITMAGCSDDTYGLEGEGTVTLRATINNDVKVVSRAMTQEELSEQCNIWISQVDRGLVRKYVGIDNVPVEGISLVSGDYVAEAWTGDSVPASFDSKYYKGSTNFTVSAGSREDVDLTLRVANVVTSVTYMPDVDDVLRDYTFKVEHTRGSLTFEGRDDRKGYFMMPNGVTDLNWTLTGTKMDGTQFVRTGTIASVKPTTEYAVTVRCSTSSEEIGGGFLTIEIDESELVVEDQIVISTAPAIVGYNFDISNPIYSEMGAVGRRSVWVNASNPLSSVVLESVVLNDGTHMAIGGNDVDLVNGSSSVLANVRAGGITVTYPWVGDDGVSNSKMMKIAFEESLLNALANGDYTFNITATDVTGRVGRGTLSISISDAKAAPVDVNTNDILHSARTTVLSGKLLKDGVSSVGFEYRKAGSGSWTAVPAVIGAEGYVANGSFTAYVTGLEPGTTYEYRPVADGIAIQASKTVTTEPATQLPNSGFESWQTSSTPYLIYGSGEDMFWDSGNHGSAKMSKNVTTPDGSIKHSGNYSIKLASQFVGIGSIGAFAAGNVFIGQFIGTEQTTQGILGFGRPFTGRPVALKGYAKYTPATINYVSSNAPSEYVKGQMDRGIIYIALLDDSIIETWNGVETPVLIRTAVPKLFDSNGSNVIAYGELIFDGATAGDGMVEFEVNLNYVRTDVRPSYILCTASASKGGDYFTGGAGSTLWLDDLELVY